MRTRLSGRRRTVARLLVADDDPALAEVVGAHLSALGHRVTSVSSGSAALAALQGEPFDLALLDIVMPSPDGLEVLRALADDPDPPAVIITTGVGAIDTAVHALRLGAFAYLAKPFRMAELDLVVARALEQRTLAHQNAALRLQVPRASSAPEFVTQFAPLRAVVASAIDVAARDVPVLIVGEPGAGKGTLARLMHAKSPRAARPFIELDARTLAHADAGVTLFGGPRAASGALPRSALASRGTLYLRDVHALGAHEQARLGRALIEGSFVAPRGTEPRPVRARVIGGASAPLADARTRAAPELAAALDAAVIALPPLRDHLVDIPLLVSSFLARAGDAVRWRVDDDAIALLRGYSWPGNVAELRAVIDRARLVASGGVIGAADLALAASGPVVALAELERRHIASVLHAQGWHQGRTAELLGISPKTLYRKIREFGLHRPSGGGDAAP